MEFPAALALARGLLAEHGLHDWRVVADRAKTRAGACHYGTRTISLSRPITAVHGEAEVRDTILHEIAHALVGPEHAHDALWRATARRIGGSGERCVRTEGPLVAGDWVGRCPAGHVTTRHRGPSRPLSCGRCSRSFDARHLLTWTYRGRPAVMSASYAAALASLPTVLATADDHRARPDLGDRVSVVAEGRWRGAVGEIEFVGASRVQVRLAAGLVSLPLDAVTVIGSRQESA